MHALVEEYARRPVELGYDDALRTVDDECSGRSHIWDIAQIHVLDSRVEVLVIRVAAGKAEFCLQRHVVGVASFKTFFDRILWRLDEIVNELELVVVSCVFDREYFLEHLKKTLVSPVLRSSVELEEVLERLQLHFKKVRVFKYFRGREINSCIIGLF